MPSFRIKSATDLDRELYWRVNKRSKHLQLTDTIEKASLFRAKIDEDETSFTITTAKDPSATIHCKPNSSSRERSLVAKVACSGGEEYRFELRRPSEYGTSIDATQAVHKWMGGDSFIVKPADTSRDDNALAMCNGQFYKKLKSMSMHDSEGKHGYYYMTWTCTKNN